MTWGMPLPLAFANQRCVSHASSAKPKGVISNGDQGAHSSKRLNDANAASASHANANAASPTRSAPIQNARRCRHSRQYEVLEEGVAVFKSAIVCHVMGTDREYGVICRAGIPDRGGTHAQSGRRVISHLPDIRRFVMTSTGPGQLKSCCAWRLHPRSNPALRR